MLITQKPIVVIGSINIDLVVSAERIPAPGETVQGSNFKIHFGGKGANQAVAVARLGYPVQMIGKVGSDAFGEQLRAHLISAGVGTAGVEMMEDASGTALIMVDPQGENRIVIIPGANAHVTPEYLDLHRSLIQNAGIVLTQLEIPTNTVEHLARICDEEKVPLILDPAPPKEIPASIFKQVQWFTPNETEAAFFTYKSEPNARRAKQGDIASLLLQRGMAGIVLKMGSHGAYLATKNEIQDQVSAFPVHAVDTTAAGDAFNGAFATGLMLGKSPVESARFAAAAAALSVTRPGAQSSMPNRDEVEQLLATFSEQDMSPKQRQ